MTEIADEIRSATSRGELHPLVASNKASPRGKCNAVVTGDTDGGIMWCTRDYAHDGEHENDSGVRALDRIGAFCQEIIGS